MPSTVTQPTPQALAKFEMHRSRWQDAVGQAETLALEVSALEGVLADRLRFEQPTVGRAPGPAELFIRKTKALRRALQDCGSKQRMQSRCDNEPNMSASFQE